MSHTTVNGEWTALIERQASLLRAQISSLTAYTQRCGGTAEDIHRLCSPYFDELARIFSEDFQLAKAIEQSDLLLRLDGIALHRKAPRVSLISGVFTSVRRQISSVAFAISGVLRPKGTLPKDVDLGLSAFATGSLYLGFTLADPNVDDSGVPTLLGEVDPLYAATKEAIKVIGIVTHQVTEGADLKEIEAELKDPKVRDTALAAVQHLAPSGKSGFDSVMVTGREFPSSKFAAMTPETRANIKELIKHPVYSTERDSFDGTVRELDLDLHRFELRRLVGSEIQEIRCVYPNQYSDSQAREWLDKKVHVKGTVERNPEGVPRLLEIEELTIPAAAPQPTTGTLFP